MQTTRDYILHYLSGKWFRYVCGLLLVFASAYFTASIPRLLGVAIDRLGEASPVYEIVSAAWSIVFAALLAFALRFLWRFLIFGFTRGAETYVRKRVFMHLELLAADFYIKFNTGDIITRSISDVQAIRRMFGFGFVAVLDALTIFIIAGFNMVTTAGLGMSALVLLPAPFLMAFVWKIRKTLRARQYEIREASSELASKVQENITGIRVIKAYAQEGGETASFEGLSRNRWAKEMRMVRLSASIGPIIQIAFALVFAIFIVFGSQMVANGTLSVGQFTAFNGYIILMAMPVANVGRVMEVWQTGFSSMERLDEMFKFKPAVTDDFAEEGTAVTQGRLDFTDLSFSYPDCEPVLRDLSFSIAPGETLAIMGVVGSGKTTLASIVLRQWKIKQGMIAVDGNDINSIPVKTLRAAIGYVPQDSFLFSETIMDNIRFYDDSITDEDVFAAARAVSIHDNIVSFPDGYDTIVGERGVTLSGGQKQRISIARALVRRPKILLLDDCLSAVDAETEHAIISGLRQYMDGVTGIVITHRVAAAALADKIMVLAADGTLAEIGTYDELVAQKGEFYSLVQMQEGGGDNG